MRKKAPTAPMSHGRIDVYVRDGIEGLDRTTKIVNQILSVGGRVGAQNLIQIREDQLMEKRSKGGRRPKGFVRSQITCRVPANHKPVLEDAARKAGLPLSDYVALVLAEKHDLSMPTEEDAMQQKLPLTAA
jgi:hypothetical protein